MSGHAIAHVFERALVRWVAYHVAGSIGLAGVLAVIAGMYLVGRARRPRRRSSYR